MIGAGHSLAFLSGKIGVTDQTLSKWRRKQSRGLPPPKKLRVVANFESQKTRAAIVTPATLDVQLPNGLVLKNVALNMENLALLKGL